MKVRKNKFGHWETPCRGQDMGGNTYWYSLSVQFNKNCMPSDDSTELQIRPLEWFMSCFVKKDSTTAPKLVIMSYEPMGVEHGNPSDYGSGKLTDEDVKMFGEEPMTVNGEPVTEDDLPFYGG